MEALLFGSAQELEPIEESEGRWAPVKVEENCRLRAANSSQPLPRLRGSWQLRLY